MYKNLIIEFKKNNIKIKDIALTLNISPLSLREKIKGQKKFNIIECLELQRIIGDGNICLDYLFKK